MEKIYIGQISIVILILLTCYSMQCQTLCSGGYAGIYPCENVDLLSFVPKASMGGTGNVNDVWGWTDPLDGKEYAIVGLTNGTSFIDVSDPLNPLYLGILPTATFNSSWRDMKVIGNFVFIGSEAAGHGVQSFDLTNLRSIASPPVVFSAGSTLSILDGTLGNSHNIISFEEAGYILTVGTRGPNSSGGLNFINVSNPLNMTIDGRFAADGYTHDAVCFIYRGPDTEHYGKQICIASNEDTQTIVDVTDKSACMQLSRTEYVESKYSHQGWITDDQKYLLFDDELDERTFGNNTRTHVMDISDLDNPSYIGYYTSTSTSIDHNQYVKGQYSHQANYRSGYRMLDIQNIASPSSMNQVAFFDTYPQDDLANFNAVWSVYPYFKSGIVIASDIEKGLFVLRPNIPHFVMESNKIPITKCEGENIVFDINLDAYAGYSDMVDLTVTGVPAGAIATFGSTSISPNGSTTLTISNTSGITGAYSLVIQARGPLNNSIHDVSVAFKLNKAPIVPTLISPLNNAVSVDPGIIFEWNTVSNEALYKLDVATDVNFTNIVYSESGLGLDHYVPNPVLLLNQEYYWRVREETECGIGNYSNTYHFETGCPLPANASRWYVNALAPYAGIGTSWSCAFETLQEALSVAENGDEIWVAEGTYKTNTGVERDISFSMKNGVSIFGGFSGNENFLDDRDPMVYETILSADIGMVGDDSDNSYHVIYNKDVTSSAILDGFTLAGGNADATNPLFNKRGGGIFNSNSSPSIRNCKIENNIANQGGGIFNINSTVELIDCEFGNNTSLSGEGRVIYSDNSTLILDNIDIIDPLIGTLEHSIYSTGTGTLTIKGQVRILKE